MKEIVHSSVGQTDKQIHRGAPQLKLTFHTEMTKISRAHMPRKFLFIEGAELRKSFYAAYEREKFNGGLCSSLYPLKAKKQGCLKFLIPTPWKFVNLRGGEYYGCEEEYNMREKKRNHLPCNI